MELFLHKLSSQSNERDGSRLEKKEFRGKSKVCQETGRTGVGSNSKLHKLWVFLLTSQHKLPSPATLSHPLKIFSLSVFTLVSQTWSLLYVVGRVIVYQVPSYQNRVRIV